MPKKREATNEKPPKTPLGRFIRSARNARGWSQDELAARAGANMTFTSISNIERGKTELPDHPAMVGIARAFGMHVCDLYVEAGYPEFARSLAAMRSMAAEDAPEYAVDIEEFGVVTDEELAHMRELRERLRREWERAGSPSRQRTRRIVVMPIAEDERRTS